MSDNFFYKKKVNIDKLTSFGFNKDGDCYIYRTDIGRGQFIMTVRIMPNGDVSTNVTDKSSRDEYVLHRINSATGSFVGMVKSDYEEILEKISNACFEKDVFKFSQTKNLIEYVRKVYDDELEYLWEKFPDNAIWRRKDSKKWYGTLLILSKGKLGIPSDEMTEVIGLRIEPQKVETTIDHKRYFPGFHMNKKHWYSILLDGSVPIEELYNRIDESYRLALK